MRLILSSHSGLYLLDHDGSRVMARELAKGYYYGLGVKDGFVLAGRRIDVRSKESPSAFELWSTDGLCCGTVMTLNGNDILDLHQITAGPAGYYLCDGYHNRIVYTELDGLSQFLSFDNVTAKLPNSVFVDGRDVWIAFHNRKAYPSEVVHLKHHPEEDYWIFVNQYRLGAMGIHNVLVAGGWLYFNASESGSVCRVELAQYDTEDWERKGAVTMRKVTLKDSRHTKGMALDEGSRRLFVGISDNGTLSERFVSQSQLVVLDADTLEVQQIFPLAGPDGKPIGNVNEVRLID